MDYKHVFDAANDLRIGSEILESRCGEPVFPLRSTVVTAAFSAELYMKCLLYVSGRDVPRGRDGHDLKILYEALGPDLHQKIESNFKAGNHDAQTVPALIEEFKDTFNDWRYIYEKQSVAFSLNLKSLRALVKVLDRTVRVIRPDWK